MFFNFKTSLVLFMSLSVLGCTLPLNEDPPPNKVQEFNVGGQCLAGVTDSFKNFFLGTASEKEVNGVWDCTIDALKVFKSSTRGVQADQYSSREIASFFEQYYLDKDIKIHEELLTELMRIKQIFVGGDNKIITRSELDKSIYVFGLFKKISNELRPYMKIYSLNWSVTNYETVESDVKYFEEANAVIQQSASLLSKLIAENDQTYNLHSLVNLLQEISVIYNQNWSLTSDIEKYMPVIQKLKKALAGGDEAVVSPTEWASFLQLGTRGYVQYLRYYYFVKAAEEKGGAFYLAYLTRSVDDVFSLMGDLLDTKPQGVVSRSELLELLKEVAVIWPDLKVNDHLLAELMKIKKLFMGGSTTSWNSEDFSVARRKLSEFRSMTERILPYLSVYGMSWRPSGRYDEDQSYIVQAESALILFLDQMSSLITEELPGQRGYDLNDILRLSREIQNLYPEQDRDYLISKKVETYLPALISFKNMLFSDKSTVISKNMWPLFVRFLGEAYDRYLYYYYFLNGQDIYQGNSLLSLGQFVRSGLETVEGILRLKPGQTIGYSELNTFLVDLKTAGFISKDIKTETLLGLQKVLFSKILLEPEDRLEGRTASGLSVVATKFILKEFEYWFDAQMQISEIFDGAGEDGISPDVIRKRFEDLSSRFLNFSATATSYQEIADILNTDVPLTYDSQKRLHLSKNKINYSRYSLNEINWKRAFARLVIRSYVQDPKRLNNYYVGINNTEANEVYSDLKPFFIDIGWLDPANVNFANNRFREGNLFTPRANGDDYFGFLEGNDYLSMLFSGVEIDDLTRPKAFDACPGTPTPDGKDTTAELICLRNVYINLIPQYMTSMPEHVDFILNLVKKGILTEEERKKDLGGYDWVTYITNIFKSGGFEPVFDQPDSKQIVKDSDFAMAPHVMQYIESIILRFDKDTNGYLDTKEAIQAFPVYKGILKSLPDVKDHPVLIKDDEDLLALFTYFLKYGRPPEFKTVFKFIKWKARPKKWDVRADRETIARVLGYIADSVRKKPTTLDNVKEEINNQISKAIETFKAEKVMD